MYRFITCYCFNNFACWVTLSNLKFKWFIKINTMVVSQITLNNCIKTFKGTPSIFPSNKNYFFSPGMIYLHLSGFSSSFSKCVFDWLPVCATLPLIYYSLVFIFVFGQYQFKMFPLAQTQLWMGYCYWVIILSRSIPFFTFYILLLLISIFLIPVKTHLDSFFLFEMFLFSLPEMTHQVLGTVVFWELNYIIYTTNAVFLWMCFMVSHKIYSELLSIIISQQRQKCQGTQVDL